jgi:hypothetical protein
MSERMLSHVHSLDEAQTGPMRKKEGTFLKDRISKNVRKIKCIKCKFCWREQVESFEEREQNNNKTRKEVERK